MQLLPFQALYPNVQRIPETLSFLDATKEQYNNFLAAGLFKKTEKDAIYLYEIHTPQRTHRGVLACIRIDDYLNGLIKKHEHTLLQEEYKQMHLMLKHEASVKPVLLTYPNAIEVDQWIEHYIEQHTPFFEITDSTQQHRLWAVDWTPKIIAFQKIFQKNIYHAYIADGHHRMCAMALIAEKEQDILISAKYRSVYCAFFPASELDILEFNRIVEVPATFQLKQLDALFEINPLPSPAKPTQLHEMTLCTKAGWFRLNWKPEVLAAFAKEPAILDTMLLNEKVLKELLHIMDIRHDQRVEYVDAQKGLETIQNKVAENEHQIGFCLYPIRFEDLTKIVEAGKTLPPKSTWFEPRMKNGLIVKFY